VNKYDILFGFSKIKSALKSPTEPIEGCVFSLSFANHNVAFLSVAESDQKF